uniref:Uncharacterized protein n=1 Tax=Pyramimonas obovata TaxID=1411642 RepID=A0A6T7UH10_9CHLO
MHRRRVRRELEVETQGVWWLSPRSYQLAVLGGATQRVQIADPTLRDVAHHQHPVHPIWMVHGDHYLVALVDAVRQLCGPRLHALVVVDALATVQRNVEEGVEEVHPWLAYKGERRVSVKGLFMVLFSG